MKKPAKKPQKLAKKRRSIPARNHDHKREFDQLLDDAVLGVKKK